MYSDLAPYYHRWYHERPVLIGEARRAELRRMHSVMLACVRHLVNVWQDFLPLGGREREILHEQARYPFRAGTWRPDYIITPDGELKICEITSRFFAHGIFMSWFGREFIKRRFPGVELRDDFSAMMSRMLEITSGKSRIFVFKSIDKTSEIRLYERFYASAGLQLTVIETPEIVARRSEWDCPDCFLISAMNQMDIMALPDSVLQAMMARGMYSDFRNVFLIHDKRFMGLWYDDGFTSGCLSPEDTAFLRAHAIPTFMARDYVGMALKDKDSWILKPCRLGKSEGVSAGVLTSSCKWRALLRDPGDSIIQPFLPQKTWPTVWEGKAYDDYLCGMMLCVDDEYFESGFFRCSSLPVTNIGDDRKAAVLYGDNPALEPYCDVL